MFVGCPGTWVDSSSTRNCDHYGRRLSFCLDPKMLRLNNFQQGSGWIDIQAEVERADAVGEGTDGDEVDAGGGNLADEAQGDAAAGFGEGSAVDLLDGDSKIVDRKVVEENGVDVGGEDRVDLVEAIDFDFQVSGVRNYSA